MALLKPRMMGKAASKPPAPPPAAAPPPKPAAKPPAPAPAPPQKEEESEVGHPPRYLTMEEIGYIPPDNHCRLCEYGQQQRCQFTGQPVDPEGGCHKFFEPREDIEDSYEPGEEEEPEAE